MTVLDSRRLQALNRLGRATDAIQIIVLATMGQYLTSGGAQRLSGKHWVYARDFFGGYQTVGLTLILIALIGFIGLISLAVFDSDRVYHTVMWVFSGLAAIWFIYIGITHGVASVAIDGAGNTGVFSMGLAGLFFIFSRLAISISSGLIIDED